MQPARRAKLREFVAFLVVGGVSAAANWLTLFFSVEVLRVHYLFAFVASFVLVNAAAFYLNGRLAFRGRGEGGYAALLRFQSISAASLLVNTLAMKGLVDIAGWWYLGAAVCLTAVNAPINYVLHRKLTYRLPGDEPAPGM